MRIYHTASGVGGGTQLEVVVTVMEAHLPASRNASRSGRVKAGHIQMARRHLPEEARARHDPFDPFDYMAKPRKLCLFLLWPSVR